MTCGKDEITMPLDRRSFLVALGRITAEDLVRIRYGEWERSLLAKLEDTRCASAGGCPLFRSLWDVYPDLARASFDELKEQMP